MISPLLGSAFGQERVMLHSTRLLRERGCEVFFVGDRVVGDLPECDGTALIAGLSDLHWHQPMGRIRGRLNQAIDALNKIQPDLVHFIDQFDARLMHAVINRFPTFMTSHTMATNCPSSTRLIGEGGSCVRPSGYACLVWHYRQQCLRHFRGPLHRLNAIHSYRLRRSALQRIPFIGAISVYVKEALLSDGWPEQKVRLLYNPVECENPGTSREGDLPSPLIVCASRLVRHKGVDLLLKALRLLGGEMWSLWVCGEGPERPYLEGLVRRWELQDRVCFKGRLSYCSLSRVMRAACFVAQPNRGPEPFGLTVAEASALGRPVVGFDIAAVNEIVVTGRTGRLVPVGDVKALSEAMLELLRDPEKARQWGVEGRKRVSELFAPKKHVEQLLGIYQDCRVIFQKERSAICQRTDFGSSLSIPDRK